MSAKPDLLKSSKIIWLKLKEKEGCYSILEIIALYNAEFGTNNFADILSASLCPTGKSCKEEQ